MNNPNDPTNKEWAHRLPKYETAMLAYSRITNNLNKEQTLATPNKPKHTALNNPNHPPNHPTQCNVDRSMRSKMRVNQAQLLTDSLFSDGDDDDAGNFSAAAAAASAAAAGGGTVGYNDYDDDDDEEEEEGYYDEGEGDEEEGGVVVILTDDVDVTSYDNVLFTNPVPPPHPPPFSST